MASLFAMATALAVPPAVLAKDPEQGAASRLDRLHADVSRRFGDMVGGMDNFFAAEEPRDRVNRSWARLRIDSLYLEQESLRLRANAKLKLVLPDTEQRVRLLLSTEEEDTESPGSRRLSSESSQLLQDEGNVAFALRFLQQVRDQESVKLDLGARLRDDKAQAFARFSARGHKSLGDAWRATLSNNLWYFSSSGYENRLQLVIEGSPTSENRLLRYSSSVVWSEGSRGAAIGQSVGVYTKLDAKTLAALELIGRFSTSVRGDEEYFDTAELRFRWRQNFWRPWFHYEIWPQVHWRADEDYQASYGVMARIEVEIGYGVRQQPR